MKHAREDAQRIGATWSPRSGHVPRSWRDAPDRSGHGSAYGRILVLLVAMLAAACAGSTTAPAASTARQTSSATSAASPPATTARAGSSPDVMGPSCSAEAVNDGLTAAGLTMAEPPRFGCEGNWAYAYTGSPDSSTVPIPRVAILQGNGPRWSVTDGSVACPNAALPPTVRAATCGSD